MNDPSALRTIERLIWASMPRYSLIHVKVHPHDDGVMVDVSVPISHVASAIFSFHMSDTSRIDKFVSESLDEISKHIDMSRYLKKKKKGT